jgi:meso-butanediol dehydrogenase / (S,S)-butanediol dehydrogenase / diacetyl reductase
MRFQGKTALITGGGSGIGRAIATRLAQEGAKVAIADKVAQRAEETAATLRDGGVDAIGLVLDVTSEDQVVAGCETIARTLGTIDMLVNNAGLSVGANVMEMTPNEWDINFDVVLRGAYLCCRAVLPAMVEQRAGVILNIASVNGMYGIGEEGYSAAKAGLINLTQNLAVRHGSQGIRANVISPGTIRTPIWHQRLEIDPTALDDLSTWYPLGRVGEVDDVAAAAAFLCSDEAAWITGVNLPVDGGLTAGSFRMIEALGGG